MCLRERAGYAWQKNHLEIELTLVRDSVLDQGQYGSQGRSLYTLCGPVVWGHNSCRNPNGCYISVLCLFLLQCYKVPQMCLKAAPINYLVASVGQEFRQGLGMFSASGLTRLQSVNWAVSSSGGLTGEASMPKVTQVAPEWISLALS